MGAVTPFKSSLSVTIRSYSGAVGSCAASMSRSGSTLNACCHAYSLLLTRTRSGRSFGNESHAVLSRGSESKSSVVNVADNSAAFDASTENTIRSDSSSETKTSSRPTTSPSRVNVNCPCCCSPEALTRTKTSQLFGPMPFALRLALNSVMPMLLPPSVTCSNSTSNGSSRSGAPFRLRSVTTTTREILAVLEYASAIRSTSSRLLAR